MATFISQETEQPTPIVCRFCQTGRGRRILDKPTNVAAIRLRGQWQGGDFDVEPHWVPVCVEHDSTWDTDDDGKPDLDPKYQLPAFDLRTFWVVIERESKDMAIGPYASAEDATLAMTDSLLVEDETQQDCTGDCFVKPVDRYREDLAASDYEVVLIDLDEPAYTGKNTEESA